MITEPTTTFTDYAIAVAAFIFAGSLLRIGGFNRQIAVRLWAAAFAWAAIAAALGGTCHGFALWLGGLNSILWRLMLYALSLASLAMLAGTIFSSFSKKVRQWFLWAAIAKSAFTWAVLSHWPRFEVAAFDYGSAMVIVLVLQLRMLNQPTAHTAQWLIMGILVSGVAIGIQSSGFSISESFNHNDLYHLVQLIGLGLLYQGAKQLKDH